MSRILKFLNDLSFAYKIGLLPGLAAVGFVAILMASIFFGTRSATLLTLIEEGYSPSLELSRDLQGALVDVQRQMQDAVAILDPEMLVEADSMLAAFVARLDGARGNPVLDDADLDRLTNTFEQYYATARATTNQLISGETGDAVFAALQNMTQQFIAVDNELNGNTVRDQEAIAEGFASARGAQALTTQATIGATVLALILLVALSTVIIRGTTASVRVVSTGFARMSAGNFSEKLEVHAGDEIGDLGREMNEMMDTLGELIRAVLRTSQSIAQASEELAASAAQMEKGAQDQSSASGETSSAMVEIASQIESVAGSAMELAGVVDETAASIQEMGTSAQSLAENSDMLVSSVEETATTIEEMTSSIGAIATKVRVVEEVSKEAALTAEQGGAELSDVITAIGTSSADIGKIVNIIDEIADQTNLLALNAAIEAARAGEVGRGFAVVADEVRRLAERSVDSTREISQVVAAVQEGTEQAIKLTGSVLQKIVESVNKTSDLVSDVHSATEEQARGAEQILTTTTNMQTVTLELAEGAREQAASARSIMEAVENMNHMTQQVADATTEQKRGGDIVVKAIEDIPEVATQNLSASEQLTLTTASLAEEAEGLSVLTERFEV